MTHVQRFKFEECFDPETDAVDEWASAVDGFSADKMADTGTTVVEPEEVEPDPVFTSEELEAARLEAMTEGERRGRAAAGASIDGKIQQMMTGMTDGLARLLEAQKRMDSDLIEQTVRLSMTYTAKLMPELARREGIAEIEAVARDCLQGMLVNPRIVLHVSDEQVNPARDRIDGLAHDIGYEGTIVVRGDPKLAAGDCRIDWAEGGAERIAADIWNDIDGAVERTLGVTPVDRTAEPTRRLGTNPAIDGAGEPAADPAPDPSASPHAPDAPVDSPVQTAEPALA